MPLSLVNVLTIGAILIKNLLVAKNRLLWASSPKKLIGPDIWGWTKQSSYTRLRKVAQSQKQQKTRISRLSRLSLIFAPLWVSGSLSLQMALPPLTPKVSISHLHLQKRENTVSLISQDLDFLAWDSAPRRHGSANITCRLPCYRQKWGEEKFSQENQSFSVFKRHL